MVLFIAGPNSLFGQQPSGQSADEAAIRASAASYVQAFNRHDANALAEHWAPDAVYLNRSTGEEVVGRAAIANQFRTLLEEQPDVQLKVSVGSVQFISPSVAVEQGRTTLLAPNSEPEEIEYSAVNVKRDGKWLLDRVTDKEIEIVPTHYDQLKVLEWMVGEWTGSADNAEMELECNWTKNRNFLTRAFKMSLDDGTDFSGMQLIGWDPAAKSIRSWTFDANGTFAEATWEQHAGRWFLRNRGTLPDGRTATMVNVMQPIDANSFTWQTIERTAGDELLPNIDQVRMVRR